MVYLQLKLTKPIIFTDYGHDCDVSYVFMAVNVFLHFGMLLTWGLNPSC